MANFDTIVVSGAPAGRFLEGIISGTPKPGTMMQIKAATEPVNGKPTWEVFNGAADGENSLVAILLEDNLQGKTVEDAFVTGTLGRLYCPIPGDELQVLLQDVAGTGDDHAIGEKLMVDDGTGKFIASAGTPESEPFVLLETITDPEADTLAHVMYTGH
jgi:hypothetical protein